MEKPLYGVEVFVGETARFEIELSEPDVHGQWKLKGEPLTASPVSDPGRATQIAVGCLFGYFFLGTPRPQSTIPRRLAGSPVYVNTVCDHPP